jgi:hypothetical protein
MRCESFFTTAESRCSSAKSDAAAFLRLGLKECTFEKTSSYRTNWSVTGAHNDLNVKVGTI